MSGYQQNSLVRISKIQVLVLFLSAVQGMVCAQPVLHHFDSITALPDRRITLSLDGSVSNMFPNLPVTVSNQFMQMFDLYPVEASANLNDWTPLALVLRTNNNTSPLMVEDTNAPGLPQRFYRTFTNHLLTPFPKPSGTFTVGTVDRVMMDPARTNLYRYSPPTNALMVTFWYPADPPTAGVLPSAMWDRRLAADTSMYSYAGHDPQWARVAPKLVGQRFRDVPLLAGTNQYPVVLYSHGLGAFRKVVSQRGEELASHGYIFVTIDHTDCWATEFPDGRYLAGSSFDLNSRLNDLTFLLDTLSVLNTSDPLFTGRLDLERIAVYGASAGGMVVRTCHSDSRVKCVALYDATNFDPNTRLEKPLLVGLGQSNYFYSQDLTLFNQAISSAVFFQLQGADHSTPCDIGWTSQTPGGRGPTLAYSACLVWFFDTYLKGESPPFPTHPQIYNVQRK